MRRALITITALLAVLSVGARAQSVADRQSFKAAFRCTDLSTGLTYSCPDYDSMVASLANNAGLINGVASNGNLGSTLAANAALVSSIAQAPSLASSVASAAALQVAVAGNAGLQSAVAGNAALRAYLASQPSLVGPAGPSGPAGASIKGDKGDPGATGAVGPQGPSGMSDAERSDLLATAAVPATERPPTQADDSVSGYAIGDIWQFGGKVWQATSVTPGGAVWALQAVSGLPGDISGAAVACGTLRLVTSYTGALLDVTTQVGGAGHNVVTTIGQDSAHNLDRSALIAALAAEDAGTYGYVSREYNQVAGNSAGDCIGGPLPNGVIGGAPTGPHIGMVRLGKYDAASWGQNNGPSSLVVPGLTIPADHMFVGLLGRWHSTNTGQGVSPSLFSAGGLSSSNPSVQVLLGGNFAGKVSVANFLSGETVEFPLSFDALPSANAVSFGNNDSIMASGRDVVTDTSLVSGGSVTGFSLGYISGDASQNPGLNYSQQATADMAISGLVIAQQSPSRAFVDAFRANASALMGYTPQARGEYVPIGDSRTAGANTYDGLTWTSFLTGRVAGFHQHNFAVSGATSAQMVAALPQALTMGRPGEAKIMHIWVGINDRIQNVPVSTTISNLVSMVTQAQAAGFRVAVQDETIGASSDNLTLRTAIKNALDFGAIPADRQDDPFATGLPLADQANTTFWSPADRIHPSTDGHRVLGPFNADNDNTLISAAAGQ